MHLQGDKSFFILQNVNPQENISSLIAKRYMLGINRYKTPHMQ